MDDPKKPDGHQRVLATLRDATVYCERDVVFYLEHGHAPIELPPPEVDFPLNDDEKIRMAEDVATDGRHAWSRRPAIAFFTDDGAGLTVQWEVCAHELRYGWEYSHGFAQRRTWKRVPGDESDDWKCIETEKRSGFRWACEKDWI